MNSSHPEVPAAKPRFKKILIFLVLGFQLIALACAAPVIPFFEPTPTPTLPPTVTHTASPAPSPTPVPLLPPALVETQPESMAEIGINAPITMIFNQPMDHASVESAVQGQPRLSGKFVWIDDTTVRFLPDSAFVPGSEQVVTLAATARSAKGLALSQPVEITYHVADYLKIVERLPKPDTLDSIPSAAVVVSFSAPVVVLGAEAASQKPAFSLDPPANGRGEWINTSTYIFYPDPPLSGGVVYTIQPDLLIKAVNGSVLAPDQTLPWSFTVAKPKLLSFQPDPKNLVNLDAEFELIFNQAMDPRSVEENFSLQDATGLKISGQFTWNDSATGVKFKPFILLSRSSVYTLLMVGLAHASGGTELGENLLQTYTTVPQMDFIDFKPAGQDTTFAPGYSTVFLNFSVPLADQPIETMVSFKPPLENVTYYISPGSSSVTINGLFRPSANYQLIVAAGVRDRWEGVLSKTIRIDFKTRPAETTLDIPVLQTGTNVFFLPLGEKTVPAHAANLQAVTATSNALSVADFIQLAAASDLSNSFSQPPELTWQQTLGLWPNRSADFNLMLVPVGKPLSPGVYFYTMRAPELNNSLAFMAVVSRVNLVMKFSQNQLLVWAVNLDDNTPVADLALTIYDKSGVEIGKMLTDAQGLAQSDLVLGATEYLPPVFVSANQPGDPDFAMGITNWNQGISAWTFGLPVSSKPDGAVVYLYSDRPIYQPGQAVNFKAIVRQQNNGRYSPLKTNQITMRLIGDYTGETGQRPVLGSQSLQLTDFGSTFGTFILPDDAPPGYYELLIDGLENGSLRFQVAQYRKPEFSVDVSFPESQVHAGTDLEANVQTTYYFGAPAGGLKLHWVLYSAIDYFELPNQYQTGRTDLGWSQPFPWMNNGSLGKYLIEGDALTAVDGSAKINIPWAESLARQVYPQQTQNLTLEVSAVDESNLPVSGRGSVRLHPADFYIGVRPSSWSIAAGEEFGVDIQTSDWIPAPSGNHTLSARFMKMVWKRSATLDRTGVYPMVMTYSQVGSADYTTDASGRARLAFIPPDPGMYMLETSGDGALTQVTVWVSGAGIVGWPETPDQHIQLSADSKKYLPGQTAHIFIPNPFGERTLALITVERSKVMSSQVIYISTASQVIDLPLTDDFAPNVYVSVTLIGRSPGGRLDFRLGYQELTVEPINQTLTVDFVSQPETAAPGGGVKYIVKVKDAQGKPVQGEFSLALIDKAVLALSEPNSPAILDAFYGRQPLGVFSASSMVIDAQRIVPNNPVGGGGGGAETPALRENFKDTAYWNARILTDENGLAEVGLTLPDNLTTWVADLRGLTKDTRVGSAVRELITTKDMLIRPVTPRFLVEGDHLQLAALIHNNTAHELVVEAEIQTTGFTLDNPGQVVVAISVPAGGRERVTWWGTVQNVDEVELIFSAAAGDLKDAARPEQGNLPVLHYTAPQTFATSGVLPEGGDRTEIIGLPRSFKPAGGALNVELASSLASVVLSGLEAQVNFPTDFTEPVLSRLLPNLETYRALQKLALDSPGLKTRLKEEIADSTIRLSSHQNQDGGWGWIPGAESDVSISAYVLYGLSRAGQAGLFLDTAVIGKAQVFLAGKLPAELDVNAESWQLDQLAFVHFALQQSGRSDLNPGVLFDQRDKLSPWSQAFLAVTLYSLNSGDASARTLLSNLSSSGVRSASGVHWEDNHPSIHNLSSPNFATAVVLLALARIDPASVLIPDAVRYLAVHRRPTGSWSSSYESAWVMAALTETMLQTGDLQANFGFSASVNGNPLLSGKAGGGEALTPVSGKVPLDALNADRSNELRLTRDPGNGQLYYRVYLQINRPVETAPAVSHGLSIERSYTLTGQECLKTSCPPLNGIKMGTFTQPVSVRLSINLPSSMQYLVVEDYLPAGAEVVDASLKTTRQGQPPEIDFENPASSGWGWWLFGSPKVYANQVRWVARDVPAGTYDLIYQIIPVQAGVFHVLPARAYQYYFPEVEGSSPGSIFTITP